MAPGMTYAWLTLATTVAYSLIDKRLMSGLSGLAWSSPVPRSLFGFFALWLGCAAFFVPLALARLESGVLAGVLAGEWRNALVAGIISIAGYGLILEALQTAEASYVVAVRQASVLFVLVLSVRLLRERPGRVRVLGGVATVVGVALIAIAG
jgi:drug/metabolite transporter (DMT)-like permease